VARTGTSAGKAPGRELRGRRVDWKLLFNQLFAAEIEKEHVLARAAGDRTETLDRLLSAFTHYTPAPFNDVIEAISDAATSDEAYEARAEHYENPIHRWMITRLDFERSIGRELRERPCVREYLDVITRNRRRPITGGESFFASPEGRNLRHAFAFDGGEDRQSVAFVMVPGYAAHTIKYYIFEEMVMDANRFHGRPAERPILFEDGIDLEFEDQASYYARGESGRLGFDILHPAGKELGNTTGRNAETADLIYEWVRGLPERYADTKLIFLGYSKGAPIVFEMLERHPDLARRTIGCVTYGGVVQGTHVARVILDQAATLLRDVPIGEFVDRLRAEDPDHLGRVLSPLFAHVDLSWLSLPRIRSVFDILGYDITPIERQVDRILGGREVRELLDGARDMTPLERTRWNLKYLCDETFRSSFYICNLSALTNVKDFVRPLHPSLDGSPGRSLITPALTADGQLDWKHLSLDAVFLYATSIDGFKNAPAGLFDTQVDLANTKSPLLDRRPLAVSLTADEIADLWADDDLAALMRSRGIDTLDAFARTPRRELFPPACCRNIESIDLGEFRGHHWSLFVQALRAPAELSTEHAVWEFPRKAFMRALLQVLALHNLLRQSDPRRGGAA